MSVNGVNVNSFSQVVKNQLAENIGEEKAEQLIEEFSNILTDKFCEDELGSESISYEDIINSMKELNNSSFEETDFDSLKTICDEMDSGFNSDGKFSEAEWTSWFKNDGSNTFIEPIQTFNNTVKGKVTFKEEVYPDATLTTPERSGINYKTDDRLNEEQMLEIFNNFGIDTEGYKAYDSGSKNEDNIHHRELFFSKKSTDQDGNQSQVDYIKVALDDEGKQYIIHTTTFKDDDGNWSTTTNVYAIPEAENPPPPPPIEDEDPPIEEDCPEISTEDGDRDEGEIDAGDGEVGFGSDTTTTTPTDEAEENNETSTNDV